MNNNKEVSSEDLAQYKYEPLHFIRAHCEEDDMSDCTTQVWGVVFEPGNKDVVATCGGRYLCVISVSTGHLLMKYTHKERSHEFYSLSWTVLDCGKVLASSSASGEVRLFHPAREVSFYSWTQRKGVPVNAVEFHTNQPSWLFTASNKSEVSLWDIGQPDPPAYGKTKHVHLLKMVADMGDMYSMAWVGDTQWLMVGTVQGLLGWRIKEKKVKENRFPKHKPSMVEFIIPGVPSYSSPYYDSVCSLGGGLVATKCVGMGKIYVFKAGLRQQYRRSKQYDVEVLASFSWHLTNNFYMNIGGSLELGLMACGDDQGRTWVYKLPASITKEEDPDNIVKKTILPVGYLPWPDLGKYAATGQTMLDQVAFSPCGQFLVAVTDTNILAIWRRDMCGVGV